MIQVFNDHPHYQFPKRQAKQIVSSVFRNEKKRINLLDIIFISDRKIKTLNKRFLNHDRITDVIAFPLGEEKGIEGEIYVCLDAARKQAKEYAVSYKHETARLLVHGALHLIGYDDETEKERKEMKKQEEFYLKKIFG